MSAEIANADQAAAWDGGEGEFWAANESHFDLAARNFHRRFFDAVAIGADDVVLDIGCGNGATTREAARRGRSALGIDLSGLMIERAGLRAREQGLSNVDFVRGDAQVHRFPDGAFDLVISRFGAMFFADPPAAFGNIGRALRPGGRLAMLTWQPFGVNWLRAIRAALAAGRVLPEPPSIGPGPFGLSDPDYVRSVLDTEFPDVCLTSLREPVVLGTDVEDAFAFLSGSGLATGLLADLDDAARADALAQLRAVLAEHQTAGGVAMTGAAWLITATHGGDRP